jgi:hypothetical protein
VSTGLADTETEFVLMDRTLTSGRGSADYLPRN